MNSVHYFLYRLGRRAPITQTTAAERECLRKHAAGKRRLAEIGVFHGVNTRAFREVMAPDGVLLAIDPFQRSCFGWRGYGWARKIAHREVGKVSRGKVVWLELSGATVPQSALAQPHLPVDFLFVDGDHSWEGLRGDWESWKDKIQPGGVIALHDSRHRDGAGSEKFTNEVILHDPSFRLLETVDSLTVLEKI